MTSNSGQEERLLPALLTAVALPVSDFAEHANLVSRLLAPHLADRARAQLQSLAAASCRDEHTTTPTIPNSGNGVEQSHGARLAEELRLAALAAFVKLAGLPKSIPIDVNALVDFILLYTDTLPGNHAVHGEDDSNKRSRRSEEASLARKVVAALLKKKPSLAIAIERQVVPGFVALLDAGLARREAAASSSQSQWLQEAFSLQLTISSLSHFPVCSEAIARSTEFWTALQTYYDVVLPGKLASSVRASTAPNNLSELKAVSSIPVDSYIRLRYNYAEMLAKASLSLSIDIYLALLENEAGNPELPVTLTRSLPTTSLINQSLLADAEFHFAISKQLENASTAGISQEERKFVANGIRSTLLEGDVQDGLGNDDKGKGKQRMGATGVEMKTTSGENALVAQVQSILPDTQADVVIRLLQRTALAGLSDEGKVERVVGMILEGDTGEESLHQSEPPAPSMARAKVSNGTPKNQEQPSMEQTTGKSRFASVRRNIFDEQLDPSKVQVGKQDILNDPILPSSLKDSILAAVAQQQAEEAEEEEEREYSEALSRSSGAHARTAAFLEDLGGGSDVEDALAGSRRLKVRDDAGSDSEVEEEGQAMHSRDDATRETPTQAVPAMLSATGVDSATEALFLSHYTASPELFAQSSRKTPQRAELRKRTNLSNEQIEGWARMLERNPRKDKILAQATEFRGNVRGMTVGLGKPGGGASRTSRARNDGGGEGVPPDSPDTQPGSSRGGRGGGGGQRGRGGRGGRGGKGQSEQRRRGHDKKMAKAGL